MPAARGLSWQVVANALPQMLMDTDPARSQRVTRAFLRMKKLDLQELRPAYDGAG